MEEGEGGGDGVGILSGLALEISSAGGPIRDRRTGRNRRPSSTPNITRAPST